MGIDELGPKGVKYEKDVAMSKRKGKIVRIADHGLAFVSVGSGEQRRDFPFTFDKILSYRGQPAEAIGLRRGADVEFFENNGKVESVEITPVS